MRPDPTLIEATILTELGKIDAGKTLAAADVARRLAPPTGSSVLMAPIRRAAVALALRGRLVIYRKGKPVDPSDFKGVWRMGLPRED